MLNQLHQYPFEIVTVTPELALEWYSHRRANRPISSESVKPLVHALRTGQFFLSPHGLIFDTEDRLADGQHRVVAIIKSGISARMYVYRNVPDEVIDNAVDAGRVRSTSDRVKMGGDPLGDKKVSAMRLVLSVEHNAFVKVTLPIYNEVAPKLGEVHLQGVASLSKKKIPASLAAAAVLARPLNPDLVDGLLRNIAERTYSPGTEAAIARLTAKSGEKIISQIFLARAFMRGVVALLKRETIEMLRHDSDGHKSLMDLRRNAGLLTEFLPTRTDAGRSLNGSIPLPASARVP